MSVVGKAAFISSCACVSTPSSAPLPRFDYCQLSVCYLLQKRCILNSYCSNINSLTSIILFDLLRSGTKALGPALLDGTLALLD